jgi:hypothetical protein
MEEEEAREEAFFKRKAAAESAKAQGARTLRRHLCE